MESPAHPSRQAGVVRHNDGIGPDYRFWSRSFNIHFGYWRRGINPFDREAMLMEMNAEVLKRLALSPDAPAVIVDAGCGAGATLRYMAERLPAAKFCGVTLAPWLLNLGKKMNKEAGLSGRIQLIEADFQNMPLPGAFADAAFCLESACYAGGKDKVALLRELCRILKPGGRLVVVDAFRKNDRPFPAFFEKIYRRNARLWAVEELAAIQVFKKELAGSGFRNIQVEDIGWRVIPTAMHIPFVVLRLLWSGSWLRNDYWKALLLTLGMGVGMRHVGYYVVSAEKAYL
jgi:MPBQ/MSBQ methyltransferase